MTGRPIVARSIPEASPRFEEPFFADRGAMDQADYLDPSASVGGISVGNYRNDAPRLELSTPNERVPVFYVPVMLMEIPRQNAWRDGRHARNPARPTGAVACYDLRHRWETELNFAFHTVSYYIPQTAFDQLTLEFREPRIETLGCAPTLVTLDPILYHLSLALVPVIDRRAAIPSLLADEILVAVRLHLATRYGGLRLPETAPGRLSPRQIRSLKSRLLDEPARSVRLAELAASCGMPLRAFQRAFRRQFGSSPHRWRLASKVAHARTLLERTGLPLAHIAQTCGFSDQSHFTRVFTRLVGISPAAYRHRH